MTQSCKERDVSMSFLHLPRGTMGSRQCHSSTPASEGFSRFAGWTPSATKNCGNEETAACRRRHPSKTVGHTLHKPASGITRQAFTWNPQGKRKKHQETPNAVTWGELERLAQDCDGWKAWIGGLSPRRG